MTDRKEAVGMPDRPCRGFSVGSNCAGSCDDGGCVCTLLAALYDLICALPEGLYDALHADAVQAFGLRVLPFAGAGLGWICPLALGFVIGLAVHLMQKFRTK